MTKYASREIPAILTHEQARHEQALSAEDSLVLYVFPFYSNFVNTHANLASQGKQI